jgi:hypothetical protein
VRAFTTDLLQRKVKGLEDDNRKLRAEASQLASESSETELREEQLLHQVVAQLGIIQLNVSRISVVSQSRPVFKISLLAPFIIIHICYFFLNIDVITYISTIKYYILVRLAQRLVA